MRRRTEPKRRIVMVDDDVNFMEAVRLMLQPRYQLECFSSGKGLLETLETLEPDLVLLDINMPSPNGFHLCEQIRSDRRFVGLPVLFLTASRADRDFLRNLEVGAECYLNKPIGARELNNRIEEVLDAADHPDAGLP